MNIDQLSKDSIQLLIDLIKTPSLSREEENAARVIREFLSAKNIPFKTLKNNTWCYNKHWDNNKPVILLNSHIDTVKAVNNWTYDPFGATLENGKLTGLGSNDAGGPLVSLLATFRYFVDRENLPFNLIFAATAEEEISGSEGVALLVKELERVDLAIVGEPTKMELAIAEKGLLVVNCEAKGKAGHAARNEGVNSIYIATDDIDKIRNYKFDKVSEVLGEVKMTVTQIEAGFQHNVVPDSCKFVMDVRTNECYTNQEVMDIIEGLIESELNPRSLRLNSSGIDLNHPIVKKAKAMNMNCYGSPTLSDQSLMPYESTVKIGPGDSARSHTADEHIYLNEIEEGIKIYVELLEGLEI